MKTKPHIIRLLRITELEYAQAVERFGYSYVRHFCCNSRGAEEYLTRTRAFWAWWMRQFDLRDEIFLADYAEYTGADKVTTLREYWNEAHQPEAIEGRIPDHAWQQMLAMIDEEDIQSRTLIPDTV